MSMKKVDGQKNGYMSMKKVDEHLKKKGGCMLHVRP